jgi:hypothetical protein
MPMCLRSFVERARLLGTPAVLAVLALVAFPSAAAGELKPLDISPAGESGSAPRIASDGAGNIAVVWRELDGEESAIRAAFRLAGQAWGSADRISAPSAGTESPEVAMDSLGNSVAVWQRTTGGDSIVQAAIRPAGGEWGEPQDLSSPGEVAFNPDVALRAGRVTAVWTTLRDGRTVVESSSGPVTGAWTPAVTVSAPIGNASGADVAMNDQGGAVASWHWSDGPFLVVQAAVRSEGEWSSPETLSGPGRSTSAPQAAMDATGNAVVAWLRYNGSWFAAQVTYRPADGGWEPPQNLSQRGGNAAALDLAMNARGDAAVSWVQGRLAARADLWSSFRMAGSSSWTAAPVSQAWLGLQARIALDEQGNATVAWSGSWSISASFKPVGQPWQQNYLLSSYDFPAASPVVTTQAPKNATAVWIRAGTADDLIQAVSYDVNTVKDLADAEDDDEDEGDDDDDDDGDGDGESATEGTIFRGSPRADALVGTPGNDVFYGYGGNDTIKGLGGKDTIYGGPGKDVIAGGSGTDRLFGGDGADVLIGGRGRDSLRGGFGSDVLSGGRGNDVLYGSAGEDTIDGGRGRDLALGGIGRDRLFGGTGADRLFGGADDDRIAGGGGSDTLVSGYGRDVLIGGSGNDTLRALDRGSDAVFGGSGLDVYSLDRWLDRARSIESRL